MENTNDSINIFFSFFLSTSLKDIKCLIPLLFYNNCYVYNIYIGSVYDNNNTRKGEKAKIYWSNAYIFYQNQLDFSKL